MQAACIFSQSCWRVVVLVLLVDQHALIGVLSALPLVSHMRGDKTGQFTLSPDSFGVRFVFAELWSCRAWVRAGLRLALGDVLITSFSVWAGFLRLIRIVMWQPVTVRRDRVPPPVHERIQRCARMIRHACVPRDHRRWHGWSVGGCYGACHIEGSRTSCL